VSSAHGRAARFTGQEKLMFNAVIDAPFGKVGIRTDAAVVREIVYLPESIQSVDPDSPLAKRAVQQIERYFERASTCRLPTSAARSSIACGT